MPAMPNRWKPNVTVAALIEREGALAGGGRRDHGRPLKLNNPCRPPDPRRIVRTVDAREVLEETAHDSCPRRWWVYLNRFAKTRTGDDLTLPALLLFASIAGTHHSWRTLDTRILRTVWMTPD